MSFSHLLADKHPITSSANMAAIDTQAEEARIRTILEISSFDLATMERYLNLNAYILDSTNEEDIRNAIYRLYELYLDHAPEFPRNPRLTELFKPCPYGSTFVNAGFGDTRAAREAHKHEQESAKYNAVRDLIRTLATRNLQSVEAKAVKKELEAEEARTKLLGE